MSLSRAPDIQKYIQRLCRRFEVERGEAKALPAYERLGLGGACIRIDSLPPPVSSSSSSSDVYKFHTAISSPESGASEAKSILSA